MTITHTDLLEREYKKIFTGTNQHGGYDKPFLGFETETHSILFKRDNMTYFNTPAYTIAFDVTAAGLIENGAIAGVVPFYSDRIYAKTADCRDMTLVNTADIRTYNAVKLCTWLSGNLAIPSAIPIWMDRYYNPDCVSEQAAYLATDTSAVSDIISMLTFQASSWYAYYHTGESSVSGFCNMLSANSALKIDVVSNGISLIDTTPYIAGINHDNKTDSSMVVEYNPHLTRNENIVYFDNNLKQDFTVPYASTYTPISSFTYNIWFRFNTNSFTGNQLIGQGFRDGWSLTYDNNFYTPLLFFINDDGSHVITYNSDGAALNRSDTPIITAPVCILVDNDSYGWIVDDSYYNGYKHVYKLDYDGNIVDSIKFDPAIILVDAKIDRDQNVRVLALTGADSVILGYDRFGNNVPSLSTLSAGVWFNHLEVLPNNNNYLSFNKVIVDNNEVLHNIYTIKAACVGLSGLAAGNVADFNIDRNDNIWILDKDNNFYKVDSEYDLVLTGSLATTIPTTTRGTVDFTYEYNFIKQQYEDYVWFLSTDDGSVFKHDEDGNAIKKLPIKNFDLDNPIANNDFTNYQWSRKFKYMANDGQPYLRARINLASTTNSTTANRYDLYCSGSLVADNDWHMMSFAYNISSGELFLYLDGVVRDYTVVPVNQVVHYAFDSGLVFGANCGKNDTFEATIKTDQYWYNGYFYNFRMYHTTLADYQIQYLHLNRYLFEDLIWYPSYNFKSYIEEIERFFKNKLPGSKSQFYNINLTGLKITDPDIRLMIEDIIKNTVKKITPAYTHLYKINWSAED